MLDAELSWFDELDAEPAGEMPLMSDFEVSGRELEQMYLSHKSFESSVSEVR